MQFLIDASLPRDVSKLLTIHGHQPIDVRDVGLRHASDAEIATLAQSEHYALMSADFDFADIRLYPPSDYFGLVVIDRPEDAPVAEVLRLIERFLAHDDLLTNLVGRLVIVDERRIRVRPPMQER